MSELTIRVLGEISAELRGVPLVISKRRLREILGLLVSARGRTVSTSRLIDELWDDRPAGAVGAIRTFIGELRRVLEPDRAARTAPRILITTGDGYSLDLPREAVDLWRAERATTLARELDGPARIALLEDALDEWRGAAFDELRDRDWAQSETAQAAQLRAWTIEALSQALLDSGRPQRVIELLGPYVRDHPWRETGWRLLALALYQQDRQAEALATLRSAKEALVGQLGLDPGGQLSELERGILRHDPRLAPSASDSASLLRGVSSSIGSNARAQIESASAMLPVVALSGSVTIAAEQRLTIISAAEEFGDPDLLARVVGGFDVPGNWTRSDDPVLSAAIVSVASRVLAELEPTASGRIRSRLLATIAMESRGSAERQAEAVEAERIARELADPALLCFALSARFMQAFGRAGLASERLAIGAELVAVAVAADLVTFEIQGRLISMQALCALDDINAAAHEAELVDRLAIRHDRQLATVFTDWFRFEFLNGPPPPAGGDLPGFSTGLAGLAAAVAEFMTGRTADQTDFGPYEPWVRPALAALRNRDATAARALAVVPDPPHDLVMEAIWMLIGRAALASGSVEAGRRAHSALSPAAAERAAGSGAIDLGPIAPLLRELDAAGWRGDASSEP